MLWVCPPLWVRDEYVMSLGVLHLFARAGHIHGDIQANYSYPHLLPVIRDLQYKTSLGMRENRFIIYE